MKLFGIIPGLDDLFKCNPVNNQGCPSPVPKTGAPFANLGDLLTGLLNIIFFAAIFLAFYWLVWGAFAYLMAQGKKEDLQKARARITWALIGLFFILLSFFLAKFVGEVFTPSKGGLPF